MEVFHAGQESLPFRLSVECPHDYSDIINDILRAHRMGKKLIFFQSTIDPSPFLADNIIHPLDLNLAYTVIKRIDKVTQS